ncbi:MAG: hypothetical protein U5L98_16495 [Halomonas sp.]|uniref:hypothetical protein n=1 Tax=Halomonas sp. TaxID=1486246 RepID=UPI002ACE30DA|nr:hypothetical protein [Halomonas sp.]MDZ7854183.1 hypothetical protein [Halomonas sp.]
MIRDEYSIETRAAEIFDHRTKEYFREVVSSYQQGNWRSATVMLWSVAVCDIIYKLQYLRDISGDEIGKEILDEIERLQEANARSSEWEGRLIDEIEERTRLLDLADLDHLKYLQRQRHLAAHPVLSGNSELHQPNKDSVRALIRNTLDGLLTKPPIYTNRVFNALVEDLAESKSVLVTDEKLRSYIESKYLSRADLKLEIGLIRSLWKLVFRLQNDDCDAHREINYRAIKLLVGRNPSDVRDAVASESDYYSHIAQEGEPARLLIRLLSQHPSLYDCLNDAAKVIVEHVAEIDADARIFAWFLNGSLQDHSEKLIEWIGSDEHPGLSNEVVVSLQNISDSAEWKKQVYAIFNSYYGGSWSYDEADERFSVAISPFLSKYDAKDIEDLLSMIDGNSQTYDRRGARRDHGFVRDRCNELGVNFDVYRNFSRSVAR